MAWYNFWKKKQPSEQESDKVDQEPPNLCYLLLWVDESKSLNLDIQYANEDVCAEFLFNLMRGEYTANIFSAIKEQNPRLARNILEHSAVNQLMQEEINFSTNPLIKASSAFKNETKD